MQTNVVMFARKPLLRPALQPAWRIRRGLLARIRDDIRTRRSNDFDHVAVGKTLHIIPEDARALSPKINQPSDTLRLNGRAINALLNGRHANIGGNSRATRAKNLIKIAPAYSLEEMLMEPGVCVVTAAETQLWLEERGVSLRRTA